VSSVANVAYQEITGKDFGDTALAFLEGKSDTSSTSSSTAPTALASNGVSAKASSLSAHANVQSLVAYGPPRALQASMTIAQPPDDTSDQSLMSAISENGFDSALSQRALAAYNKSLAASTDSTSAF
jgi:hypothetical protein